MKLVRPYILYVGNYKPHKNVESLVNAYASLSDETRGSADLVMCGREDRFRRRVTELISRKGLIDRVTFIDFLTDVDLARLYACAEAFVFPSRYEGFGLPPLEAMACGTPVVCSNTTSLPEAVGDAALLVDPEPDTLAKGIMCILRDSETRASLVERGLHRVRRFQPDRIADELYHKLLDIQLSHVGATV